MEAIKVLVAICTLGSPSYQDREFATNTLDRVYYLPLLYCFKDCSNPEINARINTILNRQLNQTLGAYECWLYKYDRFHYYELYFGANRYIDDTKLIQDLQLSSVYRDYVKVRLVAKNIISPNQHVSFLYPGLLSQDYDTYQIYGKLWQERP